MSVKREKWIKYAKMIRRWRKTRKNFVFMWSVMGVSYLLRRPNHQEAKWFLGGEQAVGPRGDCSVSPTGHASRECWETIAFLLSPVWWIWQMPDDLIGVWLTEGCLLNVHSSDGQREGLSGGSFSKHTNLTGSVSILWLHSTLLLPWRPSPRYSHAGVAQGWASESWRDKAFSSQQTCRAFWL